VDALPPGVLYSWLADVLDASGLSAEAAGYRAKINP
jgi:hypothetical protein